VQQPRSKREIADAQLIGVLRELHAEDPEFGYRFLTDELHALGYQASERRVWGLCRLAGIRSVITKRKTRYKKALPPVHDDLASACSRLRGRMSVGSLTSPSIGRRGGGSCISARSKMCGRIGTLGTRLMTG
jgi:hypothetical protein